MPERSALLPTDTNDERPTPRRPAASMIAIPRPPLCERNPTRPGIAGCGANVALSRTSGCVLSTPRQLGPISLIPELRQISTSSRWRCAPSTPASAKPAEMTRSERTPALAHSRATSTTFAAGTTTTPRSTVPGTSRIVWCAGSDWTTSAWALTAYTAPSNSFESRFRRISPPTVPRRREAPITATECGTRKLLTAATAAVRSRSSNRASACVESEVGSSIAIASGVARMSTGKPL